MQDLCTAQIQPGENVPDDAGYAGTTGQHEVDDTYKIRNRSYSKELDHQVGSDDLSGVVDGYLRMVHSSDPQPVCVGWFCESGESHVMIIFSHYDQLVFLKPIPGHETQNRVQ